MRSADFQARCGAALGPIRNPKSAMRNGETRPRPDTPLLAPQNASGGSPRQGAGHPTGRLFGPERGSPTRLLPVMHGEQFHQEAVAPVERYLTCQAAVVVQVGLGD